MIFIKLKIYVDSFRESVIIFNLGKFQSRIMTTINKWRNIFRDIDMWFITDPFNSDVWLFNNEILLYWRFTGGWSFLLGYSIATDSTTVFFEIEWW